MDATRRDIHFFWKLYKLNREKMFQKALRRVRLELKAGCWAYQLVK